MKLLLINKLLITQTNKMENLKNLFAFLMLAITISFTACTTETSTVNISGTVTDGTNGLDGVTVTASTGETATTNSTGGYEITAAKDGSLTFSLKGYTSKTVNVDGQTTIDVTLSVDPWITSFDGNGNTTVDPQFPANSLIPSAALTATSSTDAWYTTANYKGAVESVIGTPWYANSNWSFFSRIIGGTNTSAALNTTGKATKDITDAWMQAQGTTIQWSADTIYVLDGFVFVGSGQTLNIPAGTIVQGKAGTGSNASALIVTKDAKIEATGTAADPIVFTFEGDNGNTPATERGKWGGLIILGNAGLNSSPGQTQIEGIPTSETRGLYGGSDNSDNSGTLRYVSIRHGGTNIGNDNEINGLTLGGVGSGTTIEYVEIVANKDDGIEWFGGTVNAKYLISAYCADDALDYDEGYRGKNQFVIIYQDATAADRGGEHDGGTNPETATPYATPKFWNVTSVGSSTSKAITFRDNAGGEYHNSIFMNYGKGIDIEDLEGQDQDSYKQFQDGNLKIANSIFFNIGAGTTGLDLFTVSN
ncbi:carboxypeptidase-like regulatory domain-containing protein [Aureispira anguillae]|uniref:Carboxypeptidase-like regulatory domain-containing protein n=1 Tax=Aureispira anguillae TaxID=2864201 RepID=A0A915YFB8_9BACT|nr:carboxypeptidase-like regulatory domain-containing protein [Aureispira anguillae]BDS12089.1 carboxypeptidase-like regulatory domain-containing protein [Aureispira anguillae]